MASTRAPAPAPQNGVQAPDPTSGRYEHADTTVAELQTLQNMLDVGRVTFWPVAHSWFRLNDPALDEPTHDAFVALFPQLLESFAEPRGGILTAYFCRHLAVAAVLTDIDTAADLSLGVPVKTAHPAEPATGRRARRERRELRRTASGAPAIHLEPTLGQPVDWKAKELIFRCMDLHHRALQYLTPRPRKICMRMIFGIIVALLGAIDEPPGHRRTRPFSADLHAVESLEAELEQARRYYDRSAQRQAQVEYFKGMVGGLALLLVALVALGLVVGAPSLLKEPLLAAPLAGGAGAIVSVMTRMTRDQLSLNYESGVTTIRLLGLMRPLLGALFGGAFYLLLAGGLLTVAQTPTGDETKLIYFYAGIAFLAGFSERWAQDVVTGKEGEIGPVSPSTPPAARPNPTPPVPGAR